MGDRTDPTGDAEWVIWNGGHGLVTTAALGHVESGPHGRLAWLDEPFDMVGPFSLDELETHGRIAFAACIVMSRQRWREDQARLRRESFDQRRATQRRTDEAFARFSSRRTGPSKPPPVQADDSRHRQALELPATGTLDRRQITTAFRRLAQKAHPDQGGSHDHFVRLTRARDMLLRTLS
jgi:hypothetical protein